MEFNYRADIDGLRAIAVLAVLFFHTEVPGFTGGFVGVDVFFVISGYLITSIILKEIKAEKFSIARFYERRIRRIFPALFPVIAFVLAAGAYLFDANAFKDLGKSIAATTLFSSNILFWRESGYFAAPSLQKPLLHTWSLAVEEQFYIFFPLALVFIHRYLKGQYLLWIMAAFIISLAASIYGVAHYPATTFYLLPTRAWELMVGSMLALGALPDLSKVWQRNVLTLSGLALILFSIFFYTEATLFPGASALIPVIGSGFIIYSGMEGGEHLAQRLLTARPLVFVGLISYSLYLWHWPLVAFAKYLMFRPFNGLDSAAIILASLLLATFSWKFIEQLFRGKQMLLPERKRLFTVAGVVMVVAVGMGEAVSLNDGMKWRYLDANKATESVIWEWYPNNIYGNLEQPSDHVIPGQCGDKKAQPSFLLWGDSHAMTLVPAFDKMSKKYGLSGFIATHSGCPPILGVSRADYDSNTFNQNVLKFIDKHTEIQTVVLAASWAAYINGNSKYPKILVINGLHKTVDSLKKMGRNVVLVGDFPLLEDDNFLRVFFLQKRFPKHYDDVGDLIKGPSKAEYESTNVHVYSLFKTIASTNSNVRIVRQENPFFVENNNCLIIYKNISLYRNSGHLSTYGSLFVAPQFDDLFKEMANDQSAGRKISAN